MVSIAIIMRQNLPLGTHVPMNPRLMNVVLSQKIQGHDSTHHRMRASVFRCVPTAAKLVQSRDAGVTFMAISLPARRTRISVSWPDLSASIAYV